MLSDPIVRTIRTYVPMLLGYLVAQVPLLSGVIDTEALTMAVVAGYYGLAALLENKVHPAFGWLLGLPKNFK